MKLGYRTGVDVVAQFLKLTRALDKVERKYELISPKATIVLRRLEKKFVSLTRKRAKVLRCINPLNI